MGTTKKIREKDLEVLNCMKRKAIETSNGWYHSDIPSVSKETGIPLSTTYRIVRKLELAELLSVKIGEGSGREPSSYRFTDEPKLSVLDGFLSKEENQLFAWCTECCVWHVHGYCEDLVGEVLHWNAHCFNPHSGHNRDGYYIKISPVPFKEVENSVKEATVAQIRLMQLGKTTESINRLRNQKVVVSKKKRYILKKQK